MNYENLLATYSLLALIRENSKEECDKSILNVFLPILKETLNRMLQKVGFELKGKDYTEIQSKAEEEFGLKIPIPVLETLMLEIARNSSVHFVLNKDHSFIIKTPFESQVGMDYKQQKKRIRKLEKNYKLYCEGLGVEGRFEELVAFIQDQKNRIFENKPSDIYGQGYYVSKYVYSKLKKKDENYNTICDLYLGGVIASYFQFQIKERIVDTELLIDTNFYISLINLNTEEAYESCKQLFDLTIAMGYRYSILETTIEQIKILLSKRVDKINEKGLLASLNVADVLSACDRRNLTKTDLERYKDNLLDDLATKGINIIYNSQIRNLIDKTEKSRDLRTLTKLRGNRDSAFNDLLAQEYVAFRRKDKAIAEFNDVNCWFLNNSFSVNWKEKDVPVWKRISITASDLLVLLWLANPSNMVGKNKDMLALTSLSANVVNYRSKRYPSGKVVGKLQDKIARLQLQGGISNSAVAKLCIRMAEGAIGQTEAEQLLILSSSDLKAHIEEFSKMDDSYVQKSNELERKEEEYEQLLSLSKEKDLQAKLFKMRTWGILYLISIVVVYIFGILYIPNLTNNVLGVLLQFAYWCLTTIWVNWFNHMYFVDGLKSFFMKDKVLEKLRKVTNVQ
nr:hypothetical protein [uncultured Prevotella sp.]